MTNNIIDNFDYIKSTRNILQKFRAFDKKTSSYGIILEEFNENGNGWKVAFSYDKSAEIIIIESNQIQILNIIDNEEFVNRLSRDINSKDEKTREISSEVLCYFIEFFGNLINYEFLENVVLQMLQRLKIENNYDVQQKLIEGIIEYIWFENIEEEHRQNIISDLAKLDNELLFPYFEDEDYKKYEDVNIYLSKRISK